MGNINLLMGQEESGEKMKASHLHRKVKWDLCFQLLHRYTTNHLTPITKKTKPSRGAPQGHRVSLCSVIRFLVRSLPNTWAWREKVSTSRTRTEKDESKTDREAKFQRCLTEHKLGLVGAFCRSHSHGRSLALCALWSLHTFRIKKAAPDPVHLLPRHSFLPLLRTRSKFVYGCGGNIGGYI